MQLAKMYEDTFSACSYWRRDTVYKVYSPSQKFQHTLKYDNKIEMRNIQKSFNINTQNVIAMKHITDITMVKSTLFN